MISDSLVWHIDCYVQCRLLYKAQPVIRY